MANWVKFSDRHPTMTDADCMGNIFVLREGNQYGRFAYDFIHHEAEIKCGDYDGCYWLDNVPPAPRTLEDVAKDVVDCYYQNHGLGRFPELMLELDLLLAENAILERKDDECS